jgi:2-dehydropantoate 2-reductase
MPARIVIIGAGAVGAVLAARLHRCGHPVILAAQNTVRARELRERGITVHDAQGTVTLRLPTIHVATPAPPEADIVCVCVKAYATAAVASAGARLLRAAGAVVSMQNGYGNTEALRDVAGAHLVAATPGFGATRLSAFETRFAGCASTPVAAFTAAAVPDARAWARLLRDCGLPSRFHAAFESVRWSKLVLNAGINAVTALNDVTNGAVPATPALWNCARAAAREAAEVARGLRIALLYADVSRALRRVCRATADNRSSMLQDLAAGRATEIDAINGAVVALGAQLGIATPVNAALVDAVHARHGVSGRPSGPGQPGQDPRPVPRGPQSDRLDPSPGSGPTTSEIRTG